METNYPSLYQINTRVWLTELSEKLGKKATLDDIPDAGLDQFKSMGFDWLWFLSVWTTGAAARAISRQNPEWQADFQNTLPDLKEEDIAGSGFAITDYKVHPNLGGNEALKRLRSRLHQRGMKLMLDFVPNHMAPDHPWVETHPEYFIAGTEHDIESNPQNYTKIKRKKGDFILAYGRDPYFSGWPDTLQLDYSNPATVQAMSNELLRISTLCDGVRCDMAMLVLPEVFKRTWGRRAQPFWKPAINAVRNNNESFCFMAEVYWDMEWELQQLGFNYTYDKRLYDRLCEGHARPVREHFNAGIDFQNKLARFLENHDEQRAASSFALDKHKAAAIITFLSPGLRFFHQGQFEGMKKRISPHLVRGPREVVDETIHSFYMSLLHLLKKPVFRNGNWHLLECVQAWHENESWDSFLAFSWEGKSSNKILVVVNFASYTGQCLVKLPFREVEGRQLEFSDQMKNASYIRSGNEILSNGLFVDLPAWAYHVFEIKL